MRAKIPNAREKLLANGREALLKGGYSGLSIPEVAAQCGMATGSVYSYFKNKDDLVLSVITGEWDQILNEIEENVTHEKSNRENSEYIYNKLYNFEKEFHFLYMGIINKNDEIRDESRRQMRRMCDMLGDKLEEGVRYGNVALPADSRKIAYVLVQICLLAGRNPELSFEDIWSVVHIKDMIGTHE